MSEAELVVVEWWCGFASVAAVRVHVCPAYNACLCYSTISTVVLGDVCPQWSAPVCRFSLGYCCCPTSTN
eukprot:8663177-Pyramimonas_sp.AAC.2